MNSALLGVEAARSWQLAGMVLIFGGVAALAGL
jgi:hypothetical protein